MLSKSLTVLLLAATGSQALPVAEAEACLPQSSVVVMPTSTATPAAPMVAASAAAPVATAASGSSASPSAMASVLAIVAPGSTSCSGTRAGAQCATNSQAAQPILDSFKTYGASKPNEQACLIATMAYETSEFQYNHNVFPGRKGQGCRNMQMSTYNIPYAQSLMKSNSSLSDALTKAGLTASTQASSFPTPASCTTAQNATLDAMLDLLTSNPEYDFGAAAWFYSTNCGSQKSSVQSGGQNGFNSFLTCIGITDSSESNGISSRLTYYQRAAKGLGVGS